MGTEIGLVGGTGDQIGPLFEGLLKVRTGQAQNMGHVIHQNGLELQVVDQFAHGRHRLLVQNHALAQDDKFGFEAFHQARAGFHVDLVWVFRQHREIYDRRTFGLGIAHDKVPQRSHGLGG